MKRATDAAKWADLRRRERYAPVNPRKGAKPLKEWLAERDAGFAEAAKVLRIQHMMAASVGSEECPQPTDITSRKGLRLAICIRMPDETASVWSPERGYENVRISERRDISRAFPPVWDRGPVYNELAKITRRAFLPGMFVEIYQTNPMMGLLSGSP